jgi:hypothetical protein
MMEVDENDLLMMPSESAGMNGRAEMERYARKSDVADLRDVMVAYLNY